MQQPFNPEFGKRRQTAFFQNKRFFSRPLFFIGVNLPSHNFFVGWPYRYFKKPDFSPNTRVACCKQFSDFWISHKLNTCTVISFLERTGLKRKNNIKITRIPNPLFNVFWVEWTGARCSDCRNYQNAGWGVFPVFFGHPFKNVFEEFKDIQREKNLFFRRYTSSPERDLEGNSYEHFSN